MGLYHGVPVAGDGEPAGSWVDASRAAGHMCPVRLVLPERAADVGADRSWLGADTQAASQWVCVCAQSRDLPRLIVPSLACVLARLFPSVSMVIFWPYPTEKADRHECNDRRTNGFP